MIQLNKVSLHFGSRSIFNNISYQVNPTDKIALVGKNGAGKSTLLKLINGEIGCDNGSIVVPSTCKLGYLTQDLKANLEATVQDYIASGQSNIVSIEERIEEIGNILAEHSDPDPKLYDELSDLHLQLSHLDADKSESKVNEIAMGLGFKEDDLEHSLSEFSGGWQMRAVLAKLLMDNPDVLLLDEPTNHLDIHSIQWLEQYINDYSGAMILISHDRRFLDKTVSKVLEISNGSLYEYKTSYSGYLVKKEEVIEQNEAEYANQQKHIEKTQELINKFRAKKNKAAFAQSLIKKLDKMERVELMEQDASKIKLRFPPPERSGKVVLKCTKLSKAYGNHVILKNAQLELERGTKHVLVGENGSGKSTLIKIITGTTDFKGTCELGHNVKLGYFAQDSHEDLDPKKTVFETIDEIAVGDVRKQVRGILGSFLFSGEDSDKKVSVLSGGERTRLALCKLLLEPYNFLVLDEPTNHLDIQSKEILCEALKTFEGTVLVVSHDREFVSNLTNHLLHIHEKEVKYFPYGVEEYLEKYATDDKSTIKQQPSKSEVYKPSEDALDYKERKKLKNKVGILERDIEKLEAEINDINKKLATPEGGADHALHQKHYELELTLEQKMVEWEEATQKLEAIS